MKWSARFENGEWVFYSGDVIIFRSDSMDETTAYQIVSSVNATDALRQIASDLKQALAQYQDYDAALSPEKVEAIAKKADAALQLTKPTVQRVIVING